MRRFEVSAGYVLGVMLPVLGVARRGTEFENVPAYLDDFIAGGFLLWAARADSSGSPLGPYLLAAAWGVLCGGLWGSFFGQLRNTGPADISGLPNGWVVLIKGVIYLVALTALFLSVRRAGKPDRNPANPT